jgi:agmatinase
MPYDFDPDAPASGDEGLFGLPDDPDAAVVVIPVPWEPTTSFRKGTARAPEAILEASHQVDLHDLDTGDPWEHGIRMEAVDPRLVAWNAEATSLAQPIIEAGGADATTAVALAEVNRLGAEVNAVVAARVAEHLDAGRIPAVLGGDHSVPFGAFEAALVRHPDLGILHIDAHADLREAYEDFTWSHASIFFNALTRLPLQRVVQVGLRDVGLAEHRMSEDPRVHWVTDRALSEARAAGATWASQCERILAPLPETVWISWDIDGLDPALCPATGTPVPGGLAWWQAMTLLSALSASGRRIVGFDLCEVAGEAWDANVGARLLYKLAGHALRTHADG